MKLAIIIIIIVLIIVIGMITLNYRRYLIFQKNMKIGDFCKINIGEAKYIGSISNIEKDKITVKIPVELNDTLYIFKPHKEVYPL